MLLYIYKLLQINNNYDYYNIIHIYCNNCINISFYSPFQDVNIHSYVLNV